jgi:hypothetical protein
MALACVCACAAPVHLSTQAAKNQRDERNVELASRAQPWPEASARFHSNGAWLGADSAYSIELGPQRVLWLFADTFLDPKADGSRENGPNFFIRNSVGIQSGPDSASAHDLSRSTLSFSWGPSQAGVPTSFFHDLDGAEHWIWPLHGARLPDGKLLLFRMQVVQSPAAFGFAVDAWDAIAIDDPTTDPATWKPREVATATRSFGKLIGSSVLISGAYLYAYAVENAAADHAIYLVRWPLAALTGLKAGALADPEWLCTGGFAHADESHDKRAPLALFTDGQVEFSVHYDARQSRFVEIQMQGLFLNDPHTQLAMRSAPTPQGPWSSLKSFFRPPESGFANAADLAGYAGKAHPEQRSDADLVITYVVNDLKRLPPEDAVYYPQVLRLH